MATHSSILAWGTLWTEGLLGYSPQICGFFATDRKRVGHDLATKQQQQIYNKLHKTKATA